MKVYISTNIKNYRACNKLTQAELANIFNVSPQAVSKWENEMAYPDLFLLPIIAKKMNVSIDELINSTIEFLPIK